MPWAAVPGMLDIGQGRVWKCSSAIQTCRDVAQEQIRRLTENQGSSKNPPLVWAAHTNTPEGGWQALGSSPSQRRFRMHPALGKPGPLSPSGTFPQPHHCTAVRLCQVPHGPSAHSRGRVSTQGWALCGGCPRHGSVTRYPCAGCCRDRRCQSPRSP